MNPRPPGFKREKSVHWIERKLELLLQARDIVRRIRGDSGPDEDIDYFRRMLATNQ